MSSTNPKNNPAQAPPKTATPPKRRRYYTHLSYTAQEKAQAVLAVWTDRCSASDVCRQMNISRMMFHQWQQRAMQAMLQGLESQTNLARGGALSPRLQALLQKYQLAEGAAQTNQRLEQIQNKVANPPEPPAQKS